MRIIKKKHLAFVSRQIDHGSMLAEDMLQRAGIESASLVPVACLIELLGCVALHRNIGLMRKSAGRLRRDDVLHKPLSDSVKFETATAWRSENRSSQMLSFRDAMIAFAQQQSSARQA